MRALQRATASKIAEFRRGLSGLATIRSTAPLVGLIGTAFGIIDMFMGMSKSSSAEVSAVTGGIAEALVTSAIGLAVAVPVAWLFNYFTNKVDNSSAKLIDFFLKFAPDQYRERAVLIRRHTSLFVGIAFADVGGKALVRRDQNRSQLFGPGGFLGQFALGG